MENKPTTDEFWQQAREEGEKALEYIKSRQQDCKVSDETRARVNDWIEHSDLMQKAEEVVDVHRRLRGRYGLSPEMAMQVTTTIVLLERLESIDMHIQDICEGNVKIR